MGHVNGNQCTCGQEFGLKVELALHCEKTGHRPVVVEAPVAVVAAVAAPAVPAPVVEQVATPKRSHALARPLVALALVGILFGVNCVMEKTVSCYASVQSTVMASNAQ